MKPIKFFRRLFGLSKKEKREEEKQRMRSEWENRLFNLVEEMEEEFERFEERNRRRRAVDRRKKMELELEERKKRKFYDLCQFFERRGYEFFTRTPLLKMGEIFTRIWMSLCHQPTIGSGREGWCRCILHCNGKTLQ